MGSVAATGASGPVITSLDELVEAFCHHFEYDQQGRASFISGREPEVAMRSWYLDFLHLEVTGPNSYAWVCPGCRQPRAAQHASLYTLRYDFDFWQLCPQCARPAD